MRHRRGGYKLKRDVGSRNSLLKGLVTSVIEQERVITTVDRHANTSAASIPLALDEAARDGRIAVGHRLLLIGVGGGFTWGSVFLTW